MNLELIEIAGKNLRKQGIRTFLTLIGIIIGISAIVALLSVGQGLNYAIEKEFESLGTNTIFIGAGGQRGRIQLTSSDISQIESLSEIESVVPIYAQAGIMEFKGQKIQIQINASDPEKATIFDETGYFDLKEGRLLSNRDNSSILIGQNVAENFFDSKIEIRNKVKINDTSFRVIGILDQSSQAIGGAGPSTGGTIFMTLTAFERLFDSISPAIIFAKTFTSDQVTETAKKIKTDLERKYGERTVFVSTSDQLLEQINSFLQLITIFLTGIAGLSLIVGGVGITNAMIASVLERTKEIGLLKSLGATKKEILSLFLIESAFIGGIGGTIGIILGYSLATLIAFAGETAGFALFAVINIEITLGALLFSMIVGMLSGFYPALRAANLDPINALRYE